MIECGLSEVAIRMKQKQPSVVMIDLEQFPVGRNP